jgi:hypothetical protein
MNDKTRSYVQNMIIYLDDLINNTEPVIIKKKAEIYLDINESNFKLFKIIDSEQISSLTRFVSHIRYFQDHKKIILHEVFGDLIKNKDSDSELALQYKTFQDFLFKEDELFSFLLNHFSSYIKLFDKQKKILKNESKVSFVSKIPLLNKVVKSKSFIELLKEEEMLYYELLELNNAHLVKLSKYRKDLEFFESYEKISSNLKYVATIMTTLPLGPLEVISGVLWVAYFGADKIERHIKNYEVWERTRQTQIVSLVEALVPKNS